MEDRKLGFCVRLNSYNAVTCRWQSRDRKWCHMTGVMWFHRKSPGGGCGRPKARVLSMFELLRGCNSQEVAVTCQDKTSRDLTWWEVTRKWHHFTGSHLEVPVEGLKLWFCLRLSSYGAATHKRRQSRDSKWHHVTSRDLEVTRGNVMSPEVIWKWLSDAENSGFVYIWPATGL